MLQVTNICGVLLAGGLSRRIGGGDKCLLDIGDGTILSHCIRRAESQVGRLLINANGEPARFRHYNLPVIADTLEGYLGPLAGLLAGMRWAEQHDGYTHIASFAADTPFFPRNLVSSFIAARHASGAQIVLATYGGRTHPVFGLWPIGLADELESALVNRGMRKVLGWVADYSVDLVAFEALIDKNTGGEALDAFFNINTLGDLDLAIQRPGTRDG